MAPSLPRALARLQQDLHRFDAAGHAAKFAALQAAASAALVAKPVLADYHDALLFVHANPGDAATQRLVQREFGRIAAFLRQRRGKVPAALENRGLPFADTVTRFSHDCARWLLAHPQAKAAFESFEVPKLDLNDVLRLTLPSLERNETTAALAPLELLDALRVEPARRLRFLVDELARLDAQPYVKDRLYDSLDVWVRVRPTSPAFSWSGNRLPGVRPYLQRELLRRFDPLQLMNQPLPAARELDAEGALAIALRVKNSLALTVRETDPGSYLDVRALRVHDLDRGLSVVTYGMTPDRQLPLESYVGFTLFKNGIAAAYGGAWLLGPRAAFGMNIFEPLRGGESGTMMCQVLRVYRQLFGVRFFEVDAHQFGLDNPDGIASGAYWFYYRHGFRSLDPALARLAERERERLASRPGLRSAEKTLVVLTGSNVALNFGGPVPTPLFDLTTPVTRLVQRRYRGDRAAAERDCCARFVAAAAGALPAPPSDDERRVLAEVALVAAAAPITDARRLGLLARMVSVKPVDVYGYQRLWLDYFGEG
ncbi:MAG: hypothetical protein KGN16_02535 [Burkholderiales bacterium]|nr:hypothetical protein [Burkholderiales bacterium]